MLLPAAAAVCALAAARCCPLEVLAGTSRPPVSLGSSKWMCCARSQRRGAVHLRYSLAPLDHPSRSGPQVDMRHALRRALLRAAAGRTRRRRSRLPRLRRCCFLRPP
ncbi:hypothetical protein T492DRAFT_1085403, partial [Pavlovales sp. CCMP2436]